MTKLLKTGLFITGMFLFSVADLFACTIVHADSETGIPLVGRNFDWDDVEDGWTGDPGATIVFIGQTEDDYGMVISERISVDMPYDGMNDKGLFIGQAAVPNTGGKIDLLRPGRKSLQMIVEVLKKAKTVDEALAVFKKFSIFFGTSFGNPMIHFKIADAYGDHAVLDYIEKEWVITRSSKQCEVMANHYTGREEFGSDSETSFDRYDTAKEALNKGVNSIDGVKEILKSVKQDSTIYSNIYDLENRKIYTSYKGGKYIEFDLGDELLKGTHRYEMSDFPKLVNVDVPSSGHGPVIAPQFGFGIIGHGDPIMHYGVRFLLASSNIQKFGLEVSRFDRPEDNFENTKAFYSVGIMLEQRLFNWFNMSMGSVGYFNFGPKGEHAAGFATNLGWEPNNKIPFFPFVTYRSEWIWLDELKPEMINSLSIGYRF